MSESPALLEIQKFLLAGRGAGYPAEVLYADLLAVYGIKHRRHTTHPNLVLFKYDQIASQMGSRIVQECRGIILDETDDWRIVSRAFDKFFNYGEAHAAEIDWSSASVQEKVDGSLCVLYPYKGELHVATSGTPDGCGQVHGVSDLTFAELFWKTMQEQFPKASPTNTSGMTACMVFELTGPLNRIVIPHAKASLTLLSIRDMETQREIPLNMIRLLEPHGVKCVRSFPLSSVEDVIASFANIDPLSQEGYVVVDKNFNRIKVKHPGYVALHHAKDGMGVKAFIDIVRNGERSEVLAAFPEFKEQFDDVSDRYTFLVSTVEDEYSVIKDIPVQKDFALRAVKSPGAAAMFAVRSGKAPSIKEFFQSMRVESLQDLLGYKKETPVEV